MSATLVRCPVCGTGYFPPDAVDPDTGMVACECGHRADARFLSEAAYLEARLAWVHDRIVAGDRAEASTTRALVGPSGSASTASPQTVLLSTGALLLVIAAAVFTAVAWPRLGPAGQLALIVVATGLVTALAVRLRHRLRGTAEALAALAFGLGVVVLVALPALGVAPQSWQQPESPYLSLAFAALAATAVAGGRAAELRSWSWLGWAGTVVAAGAATMAVAGPDPVDDRRVMLAFAVLAVTGAVLLAGSWLVPRLAADRRPMVAAGTVALLISLAVVAVGSLGGEVVAEAAVTTAVTAAVLGVLARMAGPESPRVFAWGAGLLAVVAAGQMLSLLPGNAAVGVLVAALGAAMLLAGVRADAASTGVVATVILWGTWLTIVSSSTSVSPPLDRGSAASDGVTWFMVGAAVALFGAAWLARGRRDITWLAWPGAVVGVVALVLLAPAGYPEVLEAWTLPAAALLALAGWVAGRGRTAGSMERVGPALAVALLPSAVATWVAPWVLGPTNAATEHLVRLGLVLGIGGVLMVLGARKHWLGVLLPASAAVLVAGVSQLWTALDALPRWVALASVGILLVLAGARFEWLRDEGRKARTWVHATN